MAELGGVVVSSRAAAVALVVALLVAGVAASVFAVRSSGAPLDGGGTCDGDP